MTVSNPSAQRLPFVAPAWLTPGRRRALVAAYILISVTLATLWLTAFALFDTFGFDARAYWSVDLEAPYAGTFAEYAFFPYPPPAAVLAAPFGLLPWPVFLAAWTALLLAVLRWLAGNWRIFALLVLFLPVVDEIAIGNIQLLLAAAIVLGFRWPVAWAFVTLTKITPGVGLLWFLVRREWRNLAMALGATALIGALSVLLLPNQWAAWLSAVAVNTEELNLPLWPRLAAAAALVVWGALRNKPWTVIVAAILAVPNFSLGAFAMVAALPALNRFVQPSSPATSPSTKPT